jgi:general stress protein YciG
MNKSERKKTGFAAMTPEKRRAVAAKGGRNAKTRHKWTPDEARAAGSKGGRAKKK